MFHAILITANNQAKAFKLAQELSADSLTPSPDTLIVDPETSVGIELIRQISRFLTRKAMIKDKKIVFLPRGEKLTLPAQNAFLKTLEEPPANSLIIIIVPQTESVLATIVSRCQVYQLDDSDKISPEFIKTQNLIYSQINKSSLSQKISLAGQYATAKNQAHEFCLNQLLFLRHQILTKKFYYLTPLLRLIVQTMTYLKQNVNPKLCLENLFFNYSNKPARSNLVG